MTYGSEASVLPTTPQRLTTAPHHSASKCYFLAYQTVIFKLWPSSGPGTMYANENTKAVTIRRYQRIWLEPWSGTSLKVINCTSLKFNLDDLPFSENRIKNSYLFRRYRVGGFGCPLVTNVTNTARVRTPSNNVIEGYTQIITNNWVNFTKGVHAPRVIEG